MLKHQGMEKNHKKSEVTEENTDILRETHADNTDFTPAEAQATQPPSTKRFEIIMAVFATTCLIGFLFAMWLALP